jgi:transposase InsO family protein
MRVLARAYGVSRKTAYKWVHRANAGGSLADQSRRPERSPTRTADAVEQQVVDLRRAHPTWGGRKLHHRLQQLNIPGVPAPSTITGILRRHHLLAPPSGPVRWTRFEADAPNDLWQLDFKGWHELQEGRVYPLTLLDDHSRFLLAATCLPSERGGPVREVLTAIFQRYGLPCAMLCDNGSPWGSSPLALTRIGAWFIQLDIRLIHGRPLHPHTQGKRERAHRTLKAAVFANHTYPDLATAQVACDRFRQTSNHVRPHEALDYATPIQRYRQSPRAFPEPMYAADVLVRQVSNRGDVRIHGCSMPVGEGLAGMAVGLRPTAIDGVLEVLFHTQVV